MIKLTRRGRVLVDGRNLGGKDDPDKLIWSFDDGYYFAWNYETNQQVGKSRTKIGLIAQLENDKHLL